jgi:hypothetical protein
MTLFSGTSWVVFSAIWNVSPFVSLIILCAAELYTVGCEVSLKEGEKETVQ